MKTVKHTIAALLAGLFIVAIATGTARNAVADTASDLQAQIQAKQQELNAVNAELAAANASLSTTKQQRLTLQAEVNTLTSNIKTLNLGIQADTLTSQQLQLQIQQLNGDLVDISASIATKQAAIQSILKNIQRNDTENGNLLALFLKSGTLATGVLEANSLLDLQAQLSTDITNLKGLHDQYDQNIQQSSAKATQIASAEQDLQAKMTIVQDQQTQKQQLLTNTKNQESIFQQQLTALQKQQQSINDDLEAIDAVLRTKIDPSTLPALGAGVLLVPVQGDTQASITQGYGATAFAQTEYVHHWHNGVDFAASIGTPILAADDGVVAATANEDLYCPHGAYGKFIVINHPNGLTTLYGHLSKPMVVVGQSVKRGQLIGYSGNTGDVTGPHLHFTVFAQATYYLAQSKSCGPLPEGGDLDPIGYLF